MTQKPRNVTNRILRILVAVVLCAPSLTISAATLYKWIDENGEVRYSDQMPAEDVRKKYQMLNEQGVVVDTKEAAKSAEELATEAKAEKALRKKLAEERRLKNERDKKDRVLLLTFSSEEEMEAVRDNRIEVIDSVIRLIRKSILTTEEQVIILEDEADLKYVSQDLEIPGGLAQKIEHFTRKATNRNQQLRRKVEEKLRINRQFDSDLERYRFLKRKEREWELKKQAQGK